MKNNRGPEGFRYLILKVQSAKFKVQRAPGKHRAGYLLRQSPHRYPATELRRSTRTLKANLLLQLIKETNHPDP